MDKTPYDFLVPELQKRVMKAGEIIKVLKEHNMNYSRGGLDNAMQVITFYYPLYEPRRGFYKILTDEDLEAYRNDLRQRKSMRSKC